MQRHPFQTRLVTSRPSPDPLRANRIIHPRIGVDVPQRPPPIVRYPPRPAHVLVPVLVVTHDRRVQDPGAVHPELVFPARARPQREHHGRPTGPGGLDVTFRDDFVVRRRGLGVRAGFEGDPRVRRDERRVDRPARRECRFISGYQRPVDAAYVSESSRRIVPCRKGVCPILKVARERPLRLVGPREDQAPGGVPVQPMDRHRGMPQIELQVREDGVHAEDAPNRTHGHARRFVQHEHVVVPVKHPRRGRRYRRYASRRTHHSVTEPGPPPTGCDEHRLVDESDAPRLPRAPSTDQR